MLTMKTKYALKALTYLAIRKTGPVTIRDIADHERIPKKFLELILRQLKQDGLLGSRKGPSGGYSLLLPATQISLAAIIQALDGPLAPLPCLTSERSRRCAECPERKTCALRLVLGEAHEATLRVLQGTTLADIVRRSGERELYAV